jgi:hypothetical protein
MYECECECTLKGAGARVHVRMSMCMASTLFLYSRTQVPRQKHKFPQTASQEIGWYNDDPMFAEEPLYKPNNNLRQCDVTLFAQRHIASKGVNPYIVRAADKA